jgi:RNA polymerase sigma factor (sigma-70 family)
MTSDGSISGWLRQLQANDPDAARHLWDRYFQRLAALARRRLGDSPRAAASEEDVALSAFASFCRGVEHGRFPHLDDRDNLWRLLVVITLRKSNRHLRSRRQQKRGGDLPAAPEPLDLDQLVSREPTPELAAEVAEACRHLLDRLNDPDLEALALWKMEGYTNDEIAAWLRCAPRTVERKLRLIRGLWEEDHE